MLCRRHSEQSATSLSGLVQVLMYAECGAVVLALDHGRTPDVSHPDLTNNLRVFAQEGFHDLARQFDIDESQTVISGSSR